jgi:hypothetical protein
MVTYNGYFVLNLSLPPLLVLCVNHIGVLDNHPTKDE